MDQSTPQQTRSEVRRTKASNSFATELTQSQQIMRAVRLCRSGTLDLARISRQAPKWLEQLCALAPHDRKSSEDFWRAVQDVMKLVPSTAIAKIDPEQVGLLSLHCIGSPDFMPRLKEVVAAADPALARLGLRHLVSHPDRGAKRWEAEASAYVASMQAILDKPGQERRRLAGLFLGGAVDAGKRAPQPAHNVTVRSAAANLDRWFGDGCAERSSRALDVSQASFDLWLSNVSALIGREASTGPEYIATAQALFTGYLYELSALFADPAEAGSALAFKPQQVAQACRAVRENAASIPALEAHLGDGILRALARVDIREVPRVLRFVRKSDNVAALGRIMDVVGKIMEGADTPVAIAAERLVPLLDRYKTPSRLRTVLRGLKRLPMFPECAQKIESDMQTFPDLVFQGLEALGGQSEKRARALAAASSSGIRKQLDTADATFVIEAKETAMLYGIDGLQQALGIEIGKYLQIEPYGELLVEDIEAKFAGHAVGATSRRKIAAVMHMAPSTNTLAVRHSESLDIPEYQIPSNPFKYFSTIEATSTLLSKEARAKRYITFSVSPAEQVAAKELKVIADAIALGGSCVSEQFVIAVRKPLSQRPELMEMLVEMLGPNVGIWKTGNEPRELLKMDGSSIDASDCRVIVLEKQGVLLDVLARSSAVVFGHDRNVVEGLLASRAYVVKGPAPVNHAAIEMMARCGALSRLDFNPEAIAGVFAETVDEGKQHQLAAVSAIRESWLEPWQRWLPAILAANLQIDGSA